MNIIVKPLISEKMNIATEKMSNRYGFVVDRRANKIQIKNAVAIICHSVLYIIIFSSWQ